MIICVIVVGVANAIDFWLVAFAVAVNVIEFWLGICCGMFFLYVDFRKRQICDLHFQKLSAKNQGVGDSHQPFLARFYL